MSKWIVHSKLTRAITEPASFEICVVREDNWLGQKSYGWFGGEKLLISHNGGPCQWPLHPKVLKKLLVLAQEVADELNREEEENLNHPPPGGIQPV